LSFVKCFVNPAFINLQDKLDPDQFFSDQFENIGIVNFSDGSLSGTDARQYRDEVSLAA